MRRPTPWIALFALWASMASAKYAMVEIETVPVDRLVQNLRAAVDKDPKSAPKLLNLARAHAMAYSLRAEEVPVRKNTDQVWFGYESPLVPFRDVTPTQDDGKVKAAKVHLDAALKLYDEALKLTPDDQRVQLGHAWLLSQTEKKADAILPLRKIIEKAWPAEKELKDLGLGRHSFTAESAGYLIPLLDPARDQAEIATLRERILHFEQLGRTVTPIVIPLRDGMEARDLENRGAAVAFDVDGSALPQRWSWTTRDAAWLVWDPRHEGKITSGLQLFGSVTFWLFWDTGYDALSALDDNHDGILTGRELEGLALWHDANGNGSSEPGEVRPLSSYGIVALSCANERLEGHPDRIAWSPVGVQYRDGRTRPTYDLVLHSR